MPAPGSLVKHGSAVGGGAVSEPGDAGAAAATAARAPASMREDPSANGEMREYMYVEVSSTA